MPSKRISIQVTDETNERFTANIPHGYRRHLLEKIIVIVLDSIEEHGPIMIGAIMADEYKIVRTDLKEKAAS
jgi:hypothetical protein